MGWMQNACALYDRIMDDPNLGTIEPIYCMTFQFHLEVTLDEQGRILDAQYLSKGGKDGTEGDSSTCIPCTENSANLTNGDAPHPLCDKLKYLAADLPGNKYDLFHAQFQEWTAGLPNNRIIAAIHTCLERRNLAFELADKGALPRDYDGSIPLKLSNEFIKKYPILSDISDSKTEKIKLRWRISLTNGQTVNSWEDKEIRKYWQKWAADNDGLEGLCIVTGNKCRVHTKHPKKTLPGNPNSKIISANDKNGFTFRGRFTDEIGQQACSVGMEVSQKAHSALRWLLSQPKFCYRFGETAYICWAASATQIPRIFDSSEDIFEAALPEDIFSASSEIKQVSEEATSADLSQDLGAAFASRLANAMRGYRSNLDKNDQITLMGLRALTSGRLSIVYYREMGAADFIDKIERWHMSASWKLLLAIPKEKQTKGGPKSTRQICAPSPSLIASAAYGRGLNDPLQGTVLEKMFHTIVGGAPLPRTLMLSCFHRAIRLCSTYTKGEDWEKESVLGTACAVIRGYWNMYPDRNERRDWTMGLDTECKNRDYLYGRLLAVAEYAENECLKTSGENRITNAERMMERFVQRPYDTWINIYTKLQNPYLKRLRTANTRFAIKIDKLFQEIYDKLDVDSANQKEPLSEIFLLGYYNQKNDFYTKKEDGPSTSTGE